MGANQKVSALTTITPTVDDLLYLVDAPSGTPASRAAAISALVTLITPLIGGRLLALTTYNPGSLTNTSTASTAGADVDATNLAVTFTVPSSGNVLIRLSAVAFVSNVAITYWWCLRTTGGANVAGTRALAKADLQNDEIAASRAVLVTGLTPGASVTYRWGHGVDGGTGNIRYGDAGGNTVYGPAVMEVWAAP